MSLARNVPQTGESVGHCQREKSSPSFTRWGLKELEPMLTSIHRRSAWGPEAARLPHPLKSKRCLLTKRSKFRWIQMAQETTNTTSVIEFFPFKCRINPMIAGAFGVKGVRPPFSPALWRLSHALLPPVADDPSPDAGPLILDFPTSELWEIHLFSLQTSPSVVFYCSSTKQNETLPGPQHIPTSTRSDTLSSWVSLRW